MEIKEIRKIAKNLAPVVRVGKSGITPSIIQEIKKHFKKKEVIKVKFLRSVTCENKVSELANDISDKTSSKVVMTIGSNAVFLRGKRK